MSVLLVESDPRTASRLLYQETEHGFRLIDQQDVSAIVDHNKLLQTMGPHRRGSEIRRVASLPLNVWQDLRNTWKAQGLSYEERQQAMRKVLNDPDLRYFRTDTTHI